MHAHGLKPHPWATKAGVRSSALYNLLAGKSTTLSSGTLQKLAAAAGVTVDEVMGNNKNEPIDAPAARTVACRWQVGSLGRLFAMGVAIDVPFPPGIDSGVVLEAAKVDHGALRPIPGDWTIYFERDPVEPVTVLGKLCVVRVRGEPDPLVREVRRGSEPGRYSLWSFAAEPMENVEIIAAHRVASICQA